MTKRVLLVIGTALLIATFTAGAAGADCGGTNNQPCHNISCW